MSERPRIPDMLRSKERHMDDVINQVDPAVAEMQANLEKRIATETQFSQKLDEEAEKRKKTPPPIPRAALEKPRRPKQTGGRPQQTIE